MNEAIIKKIICEELLELLKVEEKEVSGVRYWEPVRDLDDLRIKIADRLAEGFND